MVELYLHSPYDSVPCTGADLDLGILGFTNLLIATVKVPYYERQNNRRLGRPRRGWDVRVLVRFTGLGVGRLVTVNTATNCRR